MLEGFTLAVETAAIYLGRNFGEVTCAQFLRDLRLRLLEHSAEAAGDSTVAVRHRERLLEKTLTFTLESLPPETLHVLNLAALLPADSIVLPWLQSVGAEQFSTFNNLFEVADSAFHQTTELLIGLRLFQAVGVTDARGQVLVVRMHRLVQEILASNADLPKAPLLERLVQHAKGRCDSLEENWLEWANRWEIEPLRALSEALLARGHSQASWMANSVSRHLFALAHYSEAESLLRRALAIDEQNYGSGHPEVAARLNNLAGLLHDTNRLVEAEQLKRRALEIYEQTNGVNPTDLAAALNNLAVLLQHTNRLAEAELLMRRALAIDEESYGAEHTNVARDLNNLAQLLRITNRLAEAEPLMRRALVIAGRAWALTIPTSPSTSAT